MGRKLQQLKNKGYFFLWSNIHTLPLSLIQKWQFFHLRRLLKHAYIHLPFYIELWNFWGIKPSDIRNMHTLASLPTTNKQLFRESSSEKYTFLSEQVTKYVWANTSGSTGEPFRLVMPRFGPSGIEPPYEDFHAWRFLVWSGLLFSRVLRDERILEFRVSRSSDRNTRPFIKVDMLTKEPERVVKTLEIYKNEGVQIIGSYSSVLLELARVVRTHKVPLKFQYIVGYGDVLTPEQRRYIEETFECEMYDQYSTEEFWVLGTECYLHNGFHVHSETYIVEITDETGSPLPDGHYGKVTVTNLFNYAMPFIRYAIGDHGMIIPGMCPCGQATPRIKLLDGRRGHFLDFKSRRVHYYSIVSIMGRFSEKVLEYQLKKVNDETLEVVVVPVNEFDSVMEHDIKNALRVLLGGDIKVSIRIMQTLARLTSGKRELCAGSK